MRILWLSNAPWCPSGYAGQTSMFVLRLRELGHDMAIAVNYGLDGDALEWYGLTVYPRDGQWGNLATDVYARHHNADLVLALCDAHVLQPHLKTWPKERKLAVWAPVDHEPLVPSVLKSLKHEHVVPIAMSEHGRDEMCKAGLTPLYVPHGVDTKIFKPQHELRAQVRKVLGLPQDVFVYGMVAANQAPPGMPRKGFPEAFQAFAHVAKQHEDVWMYCHTRAGPALGGELDLEALADGVGVPRKRLMFTGPDILALGVSAETMAKLYTAFDVLLSPSYGEGFGIPMLEAQACGVPVIASDHSAMPQVAQVGWLVAGDPLWNPYAQSYFIRPHVQAIVQAMEDAYQRLPDPTMSEAAVLHAQAYDADLVTEKYWVPALKQLAPQPVVENRQMRRRKQRMVARAGAA